MKQTPYTKKQKRLIALAKKCFGENISVRLQLYGHEKDGTPIFKKPKVRFWNFEDLGTTLEIPLATLESEDLDKFVNEVDFIHFWQVSASENTLNLSIDFEERAVLSGETLAEMSKFEEVCSKCGQQYVMAKNAFDKRNEPNGTNPHCSKCNTDSIVIRQKT